MKLKRIIEIILPVTLISSYNKEATLPLWAKPIITLYTKRKVYVICKKIKNSY
jgi:hypothetical protein